MAIEGAQMGILFNAGQECAVGSRIFVHEDIYERFLDDLCKAFNRIKVGLPWDPEAQMGSITYKGHLDKVLSYIEIGKQEGARVACGGSRITESELAKGLYIQPTLLADVRNDMRVAQEEIFGPVAVVIKFSSESEVIKLANDNPYGLGGGVWTRDLNRAIRVARGIETGRMWINCYGGAPAGLPYGGYKASGYGRETHKCMLQHYWQKKSIMINLSEEPSGFFDPK